ncbi:MAG: exodeoxyribonuclease VII large subunit [Spirochaetales bacterium]|nr:exodeoxyribonuclease VII large subunit [Spirochaetales bacterium]
MADDAFAKGTGETLKKCYRISEITHLIRTMLEGEFQDITIEGEISNFRPSSTGHYYFSLKDNEAVISVVMFKSRLAFLSFTPADGMLVRAMGSISVYPKRGNYQLICESMIQAGAGAILAMLEKRKQALAAQGLFDSSRKKPLPLFPSKVAVVSSPTGAALRDILRVLRRRHSGINLVILPSPVQGDEAAACISEQIRIANLHNLAEVLIVGRGGGSLEDLLPFYEENVVRAIAASDIPVISAVGHETDITLSDLAADVRAPTPSAAAEMVSASREDLSVRVEKAAGAILSNINQRLEKIHLLLQHFLPDNLERTFRMYIQPLLLRFDDAKESLILSFDFHIREKKHRLDLVHNALIAGSPLSILKRGYAVVTQVKTGKALTSPEPVANGERLHIRLSEGILDATAVKGEKTT